MRFTPEEKRETRQNNKRLAVSIHHVAIPDVDQRFSRAMDILLKAAARDTTEEQESLPPTAKKRGMANPSAGGKKRANQ